MSISQKEIRSQLDKTIQSMRILRTNTENLLESIDSSNESTFDDQDVTTPYDELRSRLLEIYGEINNGVWTLTCHRRKFAKDNEN